MTLRSLSKNTNNISKHLKTGKVISLLIEDTLKISMESYMKMHVNVNDEIYDYNPIKLELKNNKIISKRKEFKIHINKEIKKLEIVNRVTNDTLKLSEDFKLLEVSK